MIFSHECMYVNARQSWRFWQNNGIDPDASCISTFPYQALPAILLGNLVDHVVLPGLMVMKWQFRCIPNIHAVHCAVLCCAVLCCAVLCCAVLCCAVLCCAMLCCVVLCCAALSCPGLCYAVRPAPGSTSESGLCCRVAFRLRYWETRAADHAQARTPANSPWLRERTLDDAGKPYDTTFCCLLHARARLTGHSAIRSVVRVRICCAQKHESQGIEPLTLCTGLTSVTGCL